MINLNGTTTGYGANTAELANAEIRIGNGAAPANGMYSPAANQLAISTSGSQRATVDASGRLLVGTSTAIEASVAPLQVSNTSGPATALWHGSASATGNGLGFYKTRATTVGAYSILSSGDRIGRFDFYGDDGTDIQSIAARIDVAVDGTPGLNDMPGRLVFSTTADGAASPTERLRISAAGQIITGSRGTAAAPVIAVANDDLDTGIYSPGTDQLALSTAGTERARIDSSGRLLVGTSTATANGGVLQISNGITFPGTQSACSDPNTLDDYEEGTFTPTIVGTGTAGAGTYSVQVGRYTRIGQRVYFQINLTWSAHTGTTNMIVGALPFTSANVTDAISAVSIRHSDLTSPASTVVQGFVAANAATITLESVAVAGGTAAALALDTAATLTVAGHYQAA